MTEKYGIYIRVADGSSTDPASAHQEELLRQSVEKLGGDVVGVYADYGRLPLDPRELPAGITKACADIKAGNFQRLMMVHSDRLGRIAVRQAASRQALLDAGAILHSVFGEMGTGAELEAAIQSAYLRGEKTDQAHRIALGKRLAAEKRAAGQ